MKKDLKIAKWIGTIKSIGRVAVVVVKEKRKKTRYLVSTNIDLPALEILKYSPGGTLTKLNCRSPDSHRIGRVLRGQSHDRGLGCAQDRV
jgi:hypothetical protein